MQQCQLTTGWGGGGYSYEGRQIMKTGEECLCCRHVVVEKDIGKITYQTNCVLIVLHCITYTGVTGRMMFALMR